MATPDLTPIIARSDPGAIGASRAWVHPDTGVTKYRNLTNDGWIESTDAVPVTAHASTHEAAGDDRLTLELSQISDAGTAAGSDVGDFAAAVHTHALSDIAGLVVVDDDLAVAENDNLTTHAPSSVGGAWAKKSGHTANLVGNADDDGVTDADIAVSEATRAVYENADAPATANVHLRAHLRADAVWANASGKVGVVARSQAGADTFVFAGIGFYEAEGYWYAFITEVEAGTEAGGGEPIASTEIEAPEIADGFDLEFKLDGDTAFLRVDDVTVAAEVAVLGAGKAGVTIASGHANDVGAWSIRAFKVLNPQEGVALARPPIPDEILGIPAFIDGRIDDFLSDESAHPPEESAAWSRLNDGDGLGFWVNNYVFHLGTGGSGGDYRGWGRSLAHAGDFTLVAAICSDYDDDEINPAILLRETGTGKILGVRLNQNSGTPRVEVFTMTALDGTGFSVVASKNITSIIGFPLQIRIGREGSDLAVHMGAAPNLTPSHWLYGVAQTTPFTTAPDQVAVAIRNDSGGWRVIGCPRLESWDE